MTGSGAADKAACIPSHPLEAYAPVNLGASTYEPQTAVGATHAADKHTTPHPTSRTTAADAVDQASDAASDAGSRAGEKVGELGTAVQNTAADAYDAALGAKDRAGVAAGEAGTHVQNKAADARVRGARQTKETGHMGALTPIEANGFMEPKASNNAFRLLLCLASQDAAARATDKAGQAANDTGRAVQDKASDLTNRAGQAASDAGDAVSRTAADAKVRSGTAY